MKLFKDPNEFSTFIEKLYVRGTEKMLEGEMHFHLGYEKHAPEGRNTGNSRNGKTSNTLRSKYGAVGIEVPRDRASTFEPIVVPKRSLAEGIEELVISLYAKGMSRRDIEEQSWEIYKFNISESTISNITSKISEDIQEWQQRPLEAIYCIAWLDGIVFKVRHNGKVINKSIHLAEGLNRKGEKRAFGNVAGRNGKCCLLNWGAHRYESLGCRGPAHYLQR